MNGMHAVIEANGKVAHLSAQELIGLMECAAQAAGATVLQSNVHQFGEGFGNTGVVLLAESHISVHTWPEENYAAFDIFMCGEANIARAVETLRASHPGDEFHTKLLTRGRVDTGPFMPKEIANDILLKCPLLGERIIDTVSLSANKVVDGLTETIKFLRLCSSTNETLTPSKIVDDIWHELILFTRTYEQFCQKYLTRFIHHQPSKSPQSEYAQYQKTLLKYLNEFGQPDPYFWPEAGICEADCGTCESN